MSTSRPESAISAANMTPNLNISDSYADFWFSQVILRLRREVAWCWFQRAQTLDPGTGVLPPITDATVESLDQIRYIDQKNEFFNTDPAARYLSDEINRLTAPVTQIEHSRWAWMAGQLGLDDASQFVLALALASCVDAGLGPVISTCMNDLSRPFPTLALAQRLWDDPQQIVACADLNHAIYRFGLLECINNQGNTNVWQQALSMPANVSQQLLDPDSPLPYGITLVGNTSDCELDQSAELLVARIQSRVEPGMQLIPLLGPKGAAFKNWAACLGQKIGRQVARIDNHLIRGHNDFLPLACVCWLRGLDLVLPDEWSEAEEIKLQRDKLLSVRTLPLRWYLPVNDRQQQNLFPAELLSPPLKIPSLSFDQRVKKFKQGLGVQSDELMPLIEECARRFRFQEQPIARVCRPFFDKSIPLTAKTLIKACANEASIELGNLAQLVIPRFSPKELILPETQWQQFQDVLHAMETLTVVHYHWGTARVWNESGLSVLFSGSPGTGKTMAAEALATALSLPIFRIDLSQVVNKYIGETEKNLKRIFDVAELSECILFFDECDALFGKRTEVRDAHDRFANIEISYLLERMERFKGMAILATNRRKDLDDAFMRRLRYVIEFPVPGFEERKRIWQSVFPASIDTSELDFHYLAKQFQLSGGHIRSIAFNACLRSAAVNESRTDGKVSMLSLLTTIKRELEKMNRSAGDELFGFYSDMLKGQVA